MIINSNIVIWYSPWRRHPQLNGISQCQGTSWLWFRNNQWNIL